MKSPLVETVVDKVKQYHKELETLEEELEKKDKINSEEDKALKKELPDWWTSYESKARKESDPNKKDKIYKEGLKKYPQSAPLHKC
jgi:Sec-independent protein translocase protein TatA